MTARDGIPHAPPDGMDGPGYRADDSPESDLEATAHQPSLPPEEVTETKPTEGDCTDIVPSFRPTAISAESLEEADTPALPEHLRQIPFHLELRVPLSRFTLRDLQQLKDGDLLATEHLSVRDLVLTAAGERLLLVELEAIEQQLAARVKRLAWRHKWRRRA